MSSHTDSVTAALRLLGHFWLAELKKDDLETVRALPDLAETLPSPADTNDTSDTGLANLAVEYQRLLGFNVPPYESVFIDPSGMLMAPATDRVRALYRAGGWTEPLTVRAGAPDHLGLMMLALADWWDQGQKEPAGRLHKDHLALWAPTFCLTFQRLCPHPFYQKLSELTLDLLLTLLPDDSASFHQDPFPDLPPPPVFSASDEASDETSSEASNKGLPFLTDAWLELIEPSEAGEPGGAGFISSEAGRNEAQEDDLNLRQVIKRLLSPREAGLFLTREDIALISRSLDLSTGMGDRYRMLETLFRSAGQYDLISPLFDALRQMLAETGAHYRQLAADYPAWTRYAQAWCERLGKMEVLFVERLGD